MNNKQYLDYLITSYVAQNKTTEGLKEYLQQVNQNIKQNNSEGSLESSNSKGYQKVYRSNTMKGIYPASEQKNTIFNQQGITNFLMLGFITVFFETIFILLSLCIY